MTDALYHRCPGPDCPQRIPYYLLACALHWAQVPRANQRAVYAAWKRGAGAGTPEHEHAMDGAIAHMRVLKGS